MHNKLTKEYWNSKKEIINAAARGFNMMQDLPRMLQDAYPDLKSVTFGFFSKDDLQYMHAVGWEMLDETFFDVDEFNKSDIPARFGLVTDKGGIMWNDNYLMVMGKGFREDYLNAVHERSDEMYQKSVDGKKYVAPGDPRAAEMAEYSESKLETYRAQPSGAAKRGPGRPKKK